MKIDLSALNPEQREAVTAEPCNMIIIAGAGTGKTTVLVNRIAYLIEECAVQPRQILGLTFTNKAAAQMRERIERLSAHQKLGALWLHTFHALCARLLRTYYFAAQVDPNFSILDVDGVHSELKRICSEVIAFPKYEGKDRIQVKLAEAVSRFKEAGIRACEASKYPNLWGYPRLMAFDDFVKVYERYEQNCRLSNTLDFDELILRTKEMLEQNEDLKELLHKRFKHILIDEFQDTSARQFELIKLLSGPQTCVVAVGDDDQSIYGWRGADVQNMMRFIKGFDKVKKVELKRNYRSVTPILAAANALICHNKLRLSDKMLVSAADLEGDKVVFKGFFDQSAESWYIGGKIKELHQEQGVPYEDLCVLYRNNSQSRSIEGVLNSLGIDYRVFGGMRYYGREEVLDALAYLRLCVNDNDNEAFVRVFNKPKRRIGPAKLKALNDIAAQNHTSLFGALKLIEEHKADPDFKQALKLFKIFNPFYDIVATLKKKLQEGGESFAVFMSSLIEETGLCDYYEQIDQKEGRLRELSRVANLEELVNHAGSFEAEQKLDPTLDADGKPMSLPLLFLSNAALSASTELNESGSSEEAGAGQVRLSTIHSAKGLEFDYVFVAGFQQGILPYDRNRYDYEQKDHDEERRLAYVAMTRAKKGLTLTWAVSVPSYGYNGSDDGEAGPSPFLHEISYELGRSRTRKKYTVIEDLPKNSFGYSKKHLARERYFRYS